MTAARGLLDSRNFLETIGFAVFRLSFAVAQAVQAHVGRHSVKQARWVLDSKTRSPLDEEDEHVLAGIEGLVFVAQ